MEQSDAVKELLAQLLREAKQAHEEYEKELGHFDEDWANWYAEFIVQRMSDAQPLDGLV